jgi:hypothetical protein
MSFIVLCCVGKMAFRVLKIDETREEETRTSLRVVDGRPELNGYHPQNCFRSRFPRKMDGTE